MAVIPKSVTDPALVRYLQDLQGVSDSVSNIGTIVSGLNNDVNEINNGGVSVLGHLTSSGDYTLSASYETLGEVDMLNDGSVLFFWVITTVLPQGSLVPSSDWRASIRFRLLRDGVQVDDYPTGLEFSANLSGGHSIAILLVDDDALSDGVLKTYELQVEGAGYFLGGGTLQPKFIGHRMLVDRRNVGPNEVLSGSLKTDVSPPQKVDLS